MKVINFAEQNSVLNQYLSELRDKKYQQNRLLFRNNVRRIGQIMAYELSKTLEYKTKTITTPLATIDIPLPKDDVVIATVLRAGLPFHDGFLDVFDHADNGLIINGSIYILLADSDPIQVWSVDYHDLHYFFSFPSNICRRSVYRIIFCFIPSVSSF